LSKVKQGVFVYVIYYRMGWMGLDLELGTGVGLGIGIGVRREGPVE
jgi:hypothetical protein